MWLSCIFTGKAFWLMLGGLLVPWLIWRVTIVYEKLKQLQDPYRAFLARQHPNRGIYHHAPNPWPWPTIYVWLIHIVQWPWITNLRRRGLSNYVRLSYSSLQEGQIRVLKLHPGKPWSMVECSLHTVASSPSSQPCAPYTALSYTWGPPEPTSPILCDGHLLEVTTNLHEALLYLRYMGVETIWIDAICIDQNSSQEKNKQVKMMTQIYTQAKGLIVWLGGPTKASERGMLLLDYLQLRWSHFDFVDSESIAMQVLSSIPQGSANDVRDLLFRPWFQRAWIIQELICCKSRAFVFCGTACRSWQHFVGGLTVFAKGGLLTEMENTENQLSCILSQLELLRNVQPGSLELLTLAFLARSAKASNARDKIFALLGLAKDSQKLSYYEGNSTHYFHINYDKSIHDIYVSAAKAMVTSNGLSDVLAEACGLELSECVLPTWVPDWSITQRSWEAIDTAARSIRINGLPPNFAGPTTFSASTLDSTPKFGASNVLIVNGMVYGQIKGLTPRYPVFSSNTAPDVINLAKEVSHWLESCDFLAEDCFADTSSGTSNKQDMFWRTLIADQARGQQPAPEDYRGHYYAFRISLERLVKMIQNHEHDPGLIYSLPRMFLPFSKELGFRCRGRKLGIVETGVLCLVPGTALVGDLIAVLDSCRVPIILRQFGATFRVVGDCYVHGIMYEGKSLRNNRSKSSGGGRYRERNARREFVIK